MQGISIGTCQKRKRIKKGKRKRERKREKIESRKIPHERYHMNKDLNERLKQYQRNCYASKIICFYSIKDE